jgi:hypothetical protein
MNIEGHEAQINLPWRPFRAPTQEYAAAMQVRPHPSVDLGPIPALPSKCKKVDAAELKLDPGFDLIRLGLRSRGFGSRCACIPSELSLVWGPPTAKPLKSV